MKFARVAWYVVETVASALIWQQFDSASEIQPTGAAAGGPEAGTWRRFVFHVENLTSADFADDQSFSIDIANITDGDVDSTWTDADYAAVWISLSNIGVTVMQAVSSAYRCDRVESYIRGYNPYSITKPFADSGPPERKYLTGWTGGGGSTVPPQACTTITEETASRANWGRTYLPTLSSSAYMAGGRINPALVTQLVDSFHLNYDGLMQQQFFPVVPATWTGMVKGAGGQPARVLQGVTGLRADDVVDIHRSRRHKQPSMRSIKPTPPADEPAAEPQPAV